MLRKVKTPKEMAELATDSPGASNWLSMWATVVVPLTILALGLYTYNHLESTIEARALDKEYTDSVGYYEEHKQQIDSTRDARFLDSLKRAYVRDGLCPQYDGCME